MTCDEFREWISWRLDGELRNGSRQVLEKHLASCTECARVAEEMRAAHADIGRAMESSRAPASLEGRVLAAAREGTRARRVRFLRVAVSAAAVLLIAFGVAVFQIDRMEATAQGVALYGTPTYEADATAALRLSVRDPRGGGVADATITLKLAGILLGTFSTDANGASSAACRMPDLPEGEYSLEVTVKSRLGEDRIDRRVSVKRTRRVLVTSDKPLYQPGQTIHVRALALNAMTLKPVAGRPALFTVADPNGNRIFKREVPTSEFGIASCDVPLADELTLGRYRIGCEVDKVSSEKAVEVKRYVLPKFKVACEIENAYYRPGETVRGTVRADYFFGKSVDRARVAVTLSAFHVDNLREFETVHGETDAAGTFAFTVKVPHTLFGMDLLRGSALVRVEAQVTDGAGHVEKGARSLTVSQQSLRVDALPADGGFAHGVEKRLLVVTTYPDGAVAPKTRVSLRQGQWSNDVDTDDAGVAEVVIPEVAPLRISARDAKGNTAEADIDPNRFARRRTLIVRTDKASYRGGESMKITVLTHRRSGTMYVDLVRSGQTALTQALELRDGRAETTIDLPAEVFGTLQVAAYSIEPDGTVARESRVVHVNLPEQLRIRPKLAKPTFKPGEDVTVDFEVIDAAGKPVRGALGVSVVDEALFHLSESKPGIEAIYFTIVEDLLKPSVEDHKHAVFSMPASDVVGDDRAMKLRSALANPGVHNFGRLGVVEPWQKIQEMERRKHEYQQHLTTAFYALLGLIVVGALLFVYGLPIVMALRQGEGLGGLGIGFGLLFMVGTVIVAMANGGAVTITGLMAVAVVSLTVVAAWHAGRWWIAHGRQGIAAVAGAVPLLALMALLVTPIGVRRASREAGVATQVAHDMAARGKAAPAVGAARAWQEGDLVLQPAEGAMPAPEKPAPADPKETGGRGGGARPAVRIREYFPETLYWNPQIITDAHGRARLTFPGADSITNWKMALSALSAKGQLGGASADLRVFQDFFVDIDFPVALTAGDVVSVPVAVYNYLAEPQTVRLVVEREAWFELLDDAEKSVEMKPNEVRGVRFLVRAAKVGTKRLTVKAFGSKGHNDAVRRGVIVRPNGKEMEFSVSDRLASTTHGRFTVPSEAIEGGTVVVVRLSPAGIGEVVTGLESLVRLPDG